MPEANVLYSVTAVVVVGLVAWVAVVLRTAKEPWSRPGVPQPRTDDVPVEGELDKPEATTAEPKADAKDADAKDADVKDADVKDADAKDADAKDADAKDANEPST